MRAPPVIPPAGGLDKATQLAGATTGAAIISGSATTIANDGNTIVNGELGVKLKNADGQAAVVSDITPPPVHT